MVFSFPIKESKTITNVAFDVLTINCVTRLPNGSGNEYVGKIINGTTVKGN